VYRGYIFVKKEDNSMVSANV